MHTSTSIGQAIDTYLRQPGHRPFDLRAVLFDMDGVLFDSMPNHARSWQKVMQQFGMHMTLEEAYLHEGRTGASTINLLSRRERGRDATQAEIASIYHTKTEAFRTLPQPHPMPGARALLETVKQQGLTPMLVTGSGQTTLLDGLNHAFPGIFHEGNLVTAFDVVHGKPDPEPYLIALQKGHLQHHQAVVVENAPLGVQSAVSAGLFTLAVNTGPLPDAVLLNKGAHLLFHSMHELLTAWPLLLERLQPSPR